MPQRRRDRFEGLILGTAVGDALGYPAEGLSRKRLGKLYPGRWRHRFLFGRGAISDDTDHTVFVAQALLRHPDDPELFARRLAMSLRWWLLGLPVGIGRATLRAILRLWIGVPPSRSGVNSAGNGAAMRAAIIGARFAENGAALETYLAVQTRITHSDPRALVGATAVAYLAAWTIRDDLDARPDAERLLAVLGSVPEADAAWHGLVDRIAAAARAELSVEAFAETIGLSEGVTGYVYHTVPVVAYAWYRHFGDFEATLEAVMNCGGDTDTTGAIAGALAGAVVGEGGIPPDWIAGIIDWPRGTRRLKNIAERLREAQAGRTANRPVSYFWPGLALRNSIVLWVTLAHQARRLAPPY